MRRKCQQRLVYKLHSSVLREAGWSLDLPLSDALRDCPECVVPLGSSQLLRFIDVLNGATGADAAIADIKAQIAAVRRMRPGKGPTVRMNELYDELCAVSFQKDYVCVVMDSMRDYDRANRGFSVNGTEYRRLLGTNGGIKQSTVVYVNAGLWSALKERIDNGRDMGMELVPAKLEAYQALVCSGSEPLPQPRGVVVVRDCVTRFREDVVRISDAGGERPVLEAVGGYEIEHVDSDGCGMMSPDYARRVGAALDGEGFAGEPVCGINVRWAWCKGMVYAFDFLAFADENGKPRSVVDAWGDERPLDGVDVVLTTSMLKLWDSYASMEDYLGNCEANGYEFSAAKATPRRLEGARSTNYQFLQSYDLSDEEVGELCRPTLELIRDVSGGDYRKAVLFLAGRDVDPALALDGGYDPCAKALMIDPRMIGDKFVRSRLKSMLERRVEMAKRGAVLVGANYAMVAGDPYALCQSMFGDEPVGLLGRGECYHRYWADRGVGEVACFRAPMTCANNIRKLRVADGEELRRWYGHMGTAVVLNAHDSTCEAMNGADKDGDMFMCTDNPVLLGRTRELPAIICEQQKAGKKVPSERDIVASNKLAFNDDIGKITNYITSMFERQAAFEPGSEEYGELAYRIMCGQFYQQNTIDRAKGVVARPMPASWHSRRACAPGSLDERVAADRKPYFMIYVYPELRRKVRRYQKGYDCTAVVRFGREGVRGVADLESKPERSREEEEYLERYGERMPVGTNGCTVNRVCRLFERELAAPPRLGGDAGGFDYSAMKSGVGYSRRAFNEVAAIYERYCAEASGHMRRASSQRDGGGYDDRRMLAERFEMECYRVCSNEDELCDIVLDLCYRAEKSKQFAWDVCGDVILKNLLEHSGGRYSVPVRAAPGDDGAFSYFGECYAMRDFVADGWEVDGDG